MNTAVVFALGCAIVYGAADFFGGLASRRAATLAVVVLSQAAGLVVLLAALPALGGIATSQDLIWGGICGIAGAVAVALLYRGLAIGSMSIVSPTTAVLAAGLPIAYGVVARGEHPTLLTGIGIVVALAAIVIVSIAPSSSADDTHHRFPPGLAEALGAGVAFGAFFVALAQTDAASGMVPLVAARLASLALFVVALVVRGQLRQLRVPTAALGTIVACGVLDMSANVLYVLAVRTGMISVVAVISSLYPAATVALAGIVLGERLTRTQWLGVALALAGVVALSVR